jgi:hypothetical protein
MMQNYERRAWTNSSIVSLAVIPLLLAAVAGTFYGIIQPIYSGLDRYDSDPAYAYLFNGIGVIQGYAPAHVDHPGTPMQVLGGIIAYLNWLLASFGGQTTQTFNEAVLANPEQYISAISLAVLFLNVSAIFYLGLRIRSGSGSLPLAALAQGGFGLLGVLMPRLVYLSPEALAIFAAVMATACLADVLFSNEDMIPNLTGTAVATGVTQCSSGPSSRRLIAPATDPYANLSYVMIVVALTIRQLPTREHRHRIFEWNIFNDNFL